MGIVVSADQALADGLAATSAARRFVSTWRGQLRDRLTGPAGLDLERLDAEQREVHTFAWAATALAAMEALSAWAERLVAGAALAPLDLAVFRLGMAEQLSTLIHGATIGPNETVRPWEFEGDRWTAQLRTAPGVGAFLDAAAADGWRAEAVARAMAGEAPSTTDDPEAAEIRRQFHRFAEERLLPNAQRWHLEDALVPDEVIAELAALGAFAVTLPADYGGLGLSRLIMCIVTEELSRGWLAAGSLGTRAEIAGDLIAQSGDPAQKARWLPAIASGVVLPAAVFTEPDNGSDLAHLKTRALQSPNGGWRVFGAKTWITHASRSDLMTLLVRTVGEPGYRGLSMLLAPKVRGTEDAPFPDAGLEGSEIEVLGYRGMREYALSFDSFEAPAGALLGGQEGQGFVQLMRTFEAARIQTAARAVGVARSAFETSLRYAQDRVQFARPLVAFPRVRDKLAAMIADIVTARELSYAAARAKDRGLRCDVEAGMAKLLAARTAWISADAGVQIHGGNGYALEFPASRILCDARILSVFEGSAEIQAQVIARGLLTRADQEATP